MARGQSRVVLNREALHEIDRGMATGLELLAVKVMDTVRPPDAPEIGEGLVEGGGWVSYVDGKRVGASQPDVKKPTALRVRGQGVTIGVGFGFPGRFNEMGTSRQPARPFLTPAVMGVVGNDAVVEQAIRTALANVLSKMRRVRTR